jgi:hypothetical protein
LQLMGITPLHPSYALIWSALTMARFVRFCRKADVWPPNIAGLGRCLRQRHLADTRR